MDSGTVDEIRAYIPDIIREQYPVQFWSMQEHGGYQNWVYQVTCYGRPIILRVTPASHRSLTQLKAELTIVNALRQRGVRVAAPMRLSGIPTINRVRLRRNTYFIILFETAPGSTWSEYPQREEDFFEAGQILARIHAETEHIPSAFERPRWDENHYIRIAKRAIPREKRWVLHKMNEHIEKLREYDETPGEFGLVHGDYQFANMLYSPEGITVIDFDEVEYHWHIYDLAVYIFYYLLGSDPSSIDVEANRIVWRRLLQGYESERRLPARLSERLPEFLRLREFMLYSSLYASLPRRTWGEWQKTYVAETERRLKAGRPFVETERLM
ncbi:MAG: phosphotransferase enzyme family protein [Spirochaetota bacterium]